MSENPFELFTDQYEAWFVENETLFQSELLALRQVVPVGKMGVEIGIGSGIFAKQLGIKYGIDPSEKMLEVARKRNLDVQTGVAEDLPYKNDQFDFAAFITSICFVNNPEKAIEEAYRVLKKNGEIIFAIIDKETVLGQFIEQNKENSEFYKYARFFSVPEIVELLENNNFMLTHIFQTLENPATSVVENPKEGHGKGSFVVIKGIKIKAVQ